jgi:hypothetical protein
MEKRLLRLLLPAPLRDGRRKTISESAADQAILINWRTTLST